MFGSVYGWERPNWFAPKGYAVPESELDVGADVLLNHNHAPPTEDGRIVEKWSFRRSNYFEHVGNECRNVMENVGLQDMSAFAKCFVSGPGAEAWLDSHPRQPHPEEDRPHRALPSADASRRRALGVHGLQGARGRLSTSSRPGAYERA